MITREQWLEKAVTALKQLFVDVNLTLPEKLKVSCGWPTQGALAGAKGRTIGQCFKDVCSITGHNEIFISPVLSDPIGVLETLVHEMCHAVDNCKSQHRAPFKRMADAVGLTGKATATVAGDDLRVTLAAMAADLGDYPHSTLDVTKQVKKQTTRLLKAFCPECGYTVRITKSWANLALPDCPLCAVTFTLED